MRKFIKIANILLFILLIFVLGYFIGKKYDFAINEQSELIGITYSANEQKIKRLMSLIDNQYIDEVDTDSLVDGAIRNIIGNLDPHSAYLNEEQVLEIEQEMKGEFVGIGIQYRIYKDTIVVTRILGESPNHNIFKTGDRIIYANRVSLVGNDVKKIASVLRGKTDTKIKINIIRNQQRKEVTAKRKAIPIKSVVAQYMINSRLGYIKLVRFGERSDQEIHKAIQNLKNAGMQTLVFDLRSNPGGIMESAERISDEFLKNKELIVYTKDKNENKEYSYATNYGLMEDSPVYVLIDENSASASEIVAGAIQEYNRGKIIGRRSFGKGLVQKEIGLGDGTRLRLTTSRYFTPSGRSIQKPYKNQKQEYNRDFQNRYFRGELINEDSIKVDESLKFTTPTGKIVYGGGGILPDVFIPIDTSRLTQWLHTSDGNAQISSFVFEFINQPTIKITNKKELLHFYEKRNVLNQFLKKTSLSKSDLKANEVTLLENYLIAYLARQFLGENEFYEFYNQTDFAIQKILEIEEVKKN